jgi:hypothetical protein
MTVTKRFASSFNGFGRKRAYPRRQGGKTPDSPARLPKKQRTASYAISLTNLKRSDENRPGFHWRATPSLKGPDGEK